MIFFYQSLSNIFIHKVLNSSFKFFNVGISLKKRKTCGSVCSCLSSQETILHLECFESSMYVYMHIHTHVLMQTYILICVIIIQMYILECECLHNHVNIFISLFPFSFVLLECHFCCMCHIQNLCRRIIFSKNFKSILNYLKSEVGKLRSFVNVC